MKTQYAGKHLSELRKKVQNFDFSTILSEGKKRISTKIGIQNPPGMFL
jgi:hypothetical protein